MSILQKYTAKVHGIVISYSKYSISEKHFFVIVVTNLDVMLCTAIFCDMPYHKVVMVLSNLHFCLSLRNLSFICLDA